MLELLVVVVIIAILTGLLLSLQNGPSHGPGITCMNNQKQLALGYLLWADDNANQFPMQVSTNNGGTLEYAANGNAALQFEALTNYGLYLVEPTPRNPDPLLCPLDHDRELITNGHFGNSNLSYFADLDVQTNSPNFPLLGDRILSLNNQPVKSGLVILTENVGQGSASTPHIRLRPNVAFSDGHVERITTNDLPIRLLGSLAANHLAMP